MNQEELRQKTEEIERKVEQLGIEALKRDPKISVEDLNGLRAEIEQIESESTISVSEGEYSRSQLEALLNEFPNWEGKRRLLNTIEKSIRRKN